MTLRRRLAYRYGSVVVLCLLLLGGLAHHEFVREPRLRREMGIPESPEFFWVELTEVFFYGMIPVVFGLGWWSMRRTLNPINELARGVERIHAGNLHESLPRTHNSDEVDRLTEVFNAMTDRINGSFQQVREFTLHASQELKTPLTVMRAQLETAVKDQALKPEQREWILAQLDEVQRLAAIVDSLTLLTKIDAGLVTLEHQPVRLDELVRECFEDAMILADPQRISVKLNECEPLTILGDRHRLRQLLLNLADNAAKYNRSGGTISFGLRRAGQTAVLEISNTGDGIPDDLQGRVFERFVRGSGARRMAADGCGLGLTIAQWIVQAHRGGITLATNEAGLTTARLIFPLAAPN
jgi:signal transduction histidine kinase